jgi:hypothetical protein
MRKQGKTPSMAYKNANVQGGAYSKPEGGKQACYDGARAYADDHRKTTGAASFKGHGTSYTVKKYK